MKVPQSQKYRGRPHISLDALIDLCYAVVSASVSRETSCLRFMLARALHEYSGRAKEWHSEVVEAVASDVAAFAEEESRRAHSRKEPPETEEVSIGSSLQESSVMQPGATSSITKSTISSSVERTSSPSSDERSSPSRSMQVPTPLSALLGSSNIGGTLTSLTSAPKVPTCSDCQSRQASFSRPERGSKRSPRR